MDNNPLVARNPPGNVVRKVAHTYNTVYTSLLCGWDARSQNSEFKDSSIGRRPLYTMVSQKGTLPPNRGFFYRHLLLVHSPLVCFRFEITTLTQRFQKRWTLCGWVNPYQISSEVPWSHHTTAVDMKCELTLHRTVAVTKQTMFPKSCFDVFWAYIRNCTASLFLPHWDNNFPLSKILITFSQCMPSRHHFSFLSESRLQNWTQVRLQLKQTDLLW